MKIPTLQELNSTFKLFAKSSFEGVQGVIRISSSKPGPTLGVTICTHGNEPCGLAAAQMLLDIFKKAEPIKGTIYIVLNNLQATERYFNATDDDEKMAARFVDINFNRLPVNTLELLNDNSYEIKRAQELRSIWKHFDYALDIHSTTQDDGPMLIAMGDEIPMELTKGIPINKLISNINTIQIGKSAGYFYGKSKEHTKTFGIECGAHTSPATFERAVESVQALLFNLGMLSGEVCQFLDSREEYFINSSVIFPNESYELVKLFKNFEFAPKGTVLAHGNGPDIVAVEDCHVLFASKTKPTHLKEEVVFLSDPVRLRKIVI